MILPPISARARRVVLAASAGALAIAAGACSAGPGMEARDGGFAPLPDAGDPCRPDPVPPCSEGLCFTEVTREAGITFTGTTAESFQIGGGAAFLDFDGDGRLDLLLGTESVRPTLYRNRGDGTFEDVTIAAGIPELPIPSRFMGFAVGDYDGDGDPDVYLVARGPNRLLRNEGDGTFTEVTDLAGVGDPSWSVAAAFGDFDGDGDLDLYVGNYIEIVEYPDHVAYPNVLYENRGDGTFVEVTAAFGVAGAGTTLAVSWSDFDGDGDLDLLVCNDFGGTVEPNRLYENTGAAAPGDRFREVAAARGAALAFFCMGIAPGDVDRDGDLDYYFTNLGDNALLLNEAGGFVDVARASGTANGWDACHVPLRISGWAAAFHDFDQDGWLDLFVSNGFMPSAPELDNQLASPNAVFRHRGEGIGFVDVSRSSGAADPGMGRGAAFGDFDGDGDIDVLQVNIDGSARLFRNDSPAGGGFLRVVLVGRASPRDGQHARLTARAGGALLVREASTSPGYTSASEQAVHFGLGDAEEVEALEVRWPSGTRQRAFALPRNTRVTLVEPLVGIARLEAPGSVRAGASVPVRVELSGRSDHPFTAELRLHSSGGEVASVQVERPSGGLAPLEATAIVPPGWVGEALLSITVEDQGGGRDQATTSLEIEP